MTRISIITAVRNGEATIGEAIASVAGQRQPAFEHLVIDGASRDGTVREVRRLQHGQLMLVSEADAGLYDAINKGIRRSTGDVIGLVHADDMLAHDGVLARVAQAFRDPALDAVYGDLNYVARADPTRIVRHWRAGAFRPRRLHRGWMPPHPTVFLRRRVFERYGLYDTRYRIASDYEAMLRFFRERGFNAAYLPEVLVTMRMGGESNRSLGHILTKSREDYRAIRAHGIGGLRTLIAKNLVKLPQFVVRSRDVPGAPPGAVASGLSHPLARHRDPGFLAHEVNQKEHPLIG